MGGLRVYNLAPPHPYEPLSIWTLSDGRAGIQNQVIGLAEAVGRLANCHIIHKKLSYKKEFDRLPSLIKKSSLMLNDDSDSIEPPWPDIIIAAGRATLPTLFELSHKMRSQSLLVQIQNPRSNHNRFDLIIAPEHDGLKAAHCVSIIGSPHRVTREIITSAYDKNKLAWSHYPRPHIAVLIGGQSKSHDLDDTTAKSIAQKIKNAVLAAGGSLFLTMSRRTPIKARHILIETLKDLPGLIYDQKGENPYMAFLGTADMIGVTEDSVNMITEAASTGKPVFRIKLKPRTLRWRQKKFAYLYDSLDKKGILHTFNNSFYHFDYEPLNETEKAARAVISAFKAKFPNRALL